MSGHPSASDPAVEMECPSCGAMVQSRLQDQAVIAELRKQGWAPPTEVSADVVKAGPQASDLTERLVQAAAAAVSAAYLPELLLPPDEFTEECKVAVAAVLRVLADELEIAFLVHPNTVVDRFRELAVEIETGDGDG